MGRNPRTRMASTANTSHCGRRGIAPKAITHRPQASQRYDGKGSRASPAWAQSVAAFSSLRCPYVWRKAFQCATFHQGLEIEPLMSFERFSDAYGRKYIPE